MLCVSTQVAGKQSCLHVWYEPQRHFLAEDRVNDFFLLALLVGNYDFLASVFVEMDGSSLALVEVSRSELTAVYEREREPIREDGSQLFLQIESQRGTPGT